MQEDDLVNRVKGLEGLKAVGKFPELRRKKKVRDVMLRIASIECTYFV